MAAWFTAAALVSFNLPPLLSLHGNSVGGSALGDGHAGLTAPAAPWALPPGPASLAGRQLPILLLAMGGDSYKDFMLNWAASVHDIQVPYVLAALDSSAVGVCKEAGVPYIYVPGVDLGQKDAHRIRAIKAALVRLVRRLLEERAAHLIVVSDTDVVWQRSPLPYFQSHPHADMFVSTDCLSVAADVAWEHSGMVAQCGHTPGKARWRSHNTGIYAVRNRPTNLAFIHAWERMLTSEPAVTPHGWVVTDQLAFNMLLEAGGEPNREVDGAHRTVWRANGTLKLLPLPVLHFPSGHLAFVQRAPDRYGVQPTAVHAVGVITAGKRNRLREFGLWRMDPGSYYRGRFLSYDNDVRGFIQRYAQQYEKASGRRMVDFHRHLLGMAWQLAAMRDALALATVTNRTLVLPTLWCWCDADQTPTVLENCTMAGTDLRLPFACPADVIVAPSKWDKAGVAYRLPGFLNSPQVALGVRAPSTVVRVGGGNTVIDAKAAAAAWSALGSSGGGSSRQGAAAVVEVCGMRPGVFGGFGNSQRDEEFDTWWSSFAGRIMWCCGGFGGAQLQSVFNYAQPRPLAHGRAEWQPPVLQRPDWCEKAAPENVPYTKYANHPCTFLQSATS